MSRRPGSSKLPFNVKVGAALSLVCLPLPAAFGLALNTSQGIDRYSTLNDPAFGVMMAADINLLFCLIAGPIAAITALVTFSMVLRANREVALQLEALATGDHDGGPLRVRLNGKVARALEDARQTQHALRVRLKVCLAEAEREHRALSREVIRMEAERARFVAEVQAARLTNLSPPAPGAGLPAGAGTPIGGGLSTPFAQMDPGADPFAGVGAFEDWIPAAPGHYRRAT